MRYAAASAALVLAVTCIFAAPAQAGGIIFSGFFCPPTIPCEQSDPKFPTPQQIIASGNDCVTRNVGLSSPNGFFNEAAGLDGNGCLSTTPEAFSALGSLRSIPQCCVVASPSGQGCTLHCDMVGQ